MNNPLNPGLLIAPHSTADWDKFGANWILDAAQYISAPTSLYFFTAGNQCFLCRLANTLNLPQGRIVTYFRLSWKDNYLITFRNQAPLGSANLTNTYLIQDTALNYIGLAKRVNDVYTLIGQFFWDKELYTWYKGRFSWWTTVNEQNTPAMAVQFEIEVEGEWVDLGTIYDTDNLWHDSAVNRCGPAVSTSYVHFDNTEIWIPKE